MAGIKRFLMVLCIASCSKGGGGAPNDADPDSINSDAMPDAPDGGNMSLAANDHCADAKTIGLTTQHVDVVASTFGATADLAAPCGVAGTPDVFFKFTLTRRELVYADTFGASAPTTLFFASSCSTARTAQTTGSDALCSTGACATSQSQVIALLDAGTHYLVLAGGSATIHFQHAEVGTGTVQNLAPGSSTPTGTTSGNGALYACDAGGAENSYWWQSCPSSAGGTFTGSTCTGTSFDTILALQLPGTETTYCDDDSCSFQSTVGANIPAGAGLYVISVDGFSQAKHGSYTLSVTRP